MIEALRPRKTYPPATEDELARFEAKLGIVLPLELRSLLMEANGAWIVDVAIPPELCPNPPGDVVGNKFCSTAEMEAERHVWDGRISADLLAFGYDDFGNLLCIGIEGPRQGKVYFWDHEEDVAGGIAMGCPVDPSQIHQNEYLVANSLVEFISLFRDFP